MEQIKQLKVNGLEVVSTEIKLEGGEELRSVSFKIGRKRVDLTWSEADSLVTWIINEVLETTGNKVITTTLKPNGDIVSEVKDPLADRKAVSTGNLGSGAMPGSVEEMDRLINTGVKIEDKSKEIKNPKKIYLGGFKANPQKGS